MTELDIRVLQTFEQLWNDKPSIHLRANGRANIIGEHTDYHLGFVFPFAIDKGIVFAASKSDHLEVHSIDYQDKLTSLDNIPAGSWQSYLTSAFNKLSTIVGTPIKLKMAFAGDLPIGAGVSSSSALCCGVIELVSNLYQLNLDNIQKVNLASEIEHGAGVQGGKMDQYTIFFGKKNEAILMDCRSMTNEVAHIPHGWSFLLINTLVKHNLVHTEYNTRRIEGEAGLQTIRKKYPNVSVGRDLRLDMLNDCKDILDPIPYNRLLHVIEENERVMLFRDAMSIANLDTCGLLLNASHKSLSRLYNVSCAELDHLQQFAMESSFIYGSRMMGGGFGGCTINLIKDNNAAELETIKDKFYQQYNYYPEVYNVSPSDGMTFL